MNSINHIVVLIKRIVLILILFSVTRILFLIYNFSLFQPVSFKDLISTFFYGIRFDFAVIYYINLPIILLHLIPGKFKGLITYQRILKIGFVVINSILLLTNIIDIEYFKFTNKRSGFEMISMIFISTDTGVMIMQYIRDYWLLAVLWIACIYSLWKFYPSIKQYHWNISKNPIINFGLIPFISIVLLLLGFGCARGLSHKPLRIISANEYVKPKYTSILLNTPFTIVNSISHNKYYEIKYFEDNLVKNYYSPIRSYYKGQPFKNENVVIIILESFSAEFIKGYNHKIKTSNTPFLDSLMQKSLVCKNAYANASRSADALPAIVSSLPTLFNNSFSASIFSANKLNSAATYLKKYGYNTSFFHGGKNGTMGFDIFCKMVDIDNYYGMSEYPDKSDYDGSWGIYDEGFLQFTAETLNGLKQPFFSVIFTLSSHPPYVVPERYKEKFPKEKFGIIHTIKYTDYALSKFFQKASTQEWYNNTLFILCADHTTSGKSKEFNTEIGRFKIPIIYFHPIYERFIGEHNEITQQIDIMPTVLDYLNYSGKFVSFGKSIFDTSFQYSVNYKNGKYLLLDSSYSLFFDEEKSIGLYDYINDPLIEDNILEQYPEKSKKMELDLKAFIQEYSTRMVYNKLCDTGIDKK